MSAESEAIEAQTAAMVGIAKMQRETPSSVELTLNAKHEVQWAIKVYCEVGKEQEAKNEALRLWDELSAEFQVSVPGRSYPGEVPF